MSYICSTKQDAQHCADICENRWKPLESVLAMLGGISDDIRNALEEDLEKKRSPTIDVSYLFDQVIPSLLGQSGESKFIPDV